MYSLIIIASLMGNGKAVAIHDVKFTTIEQCLTAKKQIVDSISDQSTGNAFIAITAVCVNTG